MSFIKYEYININRYSRPGIKNNGIKGLVMHYTANNGGTARNHKSYFNNLSGAYASAQLFVDDVEALCIIPLDEVAYHANDIQKYVNGQPYYPLRGIIGNANYSTIGLEMCLDANGNITEATFQNSVKAAKELIKMYPQITADRIWRHYDVTGKNCPAPWVAKPSELERFKKAVFSQSSTPETPKPTTKKGARAMFVYTLVKKNGKKEIWGVNGTVRWHFNNDKQWQHYLKIVKANGGDATRPEKNLWKEGGDEMRAVELMAPTVTQK